MCGLDGRCRFGVAASPALTLALSRKRERGLVVPDCQIVPSPFGERESEARVRPDRSEAPPPHARAPTLTSLHSHRNLLRHNRRIELPMRRIAVVQLQRVRARLQMNRILRLRLAVMLVRGIVWNRRIERRQFLGIDQEMMVAAVRRRIAGGLERDSFDTELDVDVLTDRGAVLRRQDRNRRAVRSLEPRGRRSLDSSRRKACCAASHDHVGRSRRLGGLRQRLARRHECYRNDETGCKDANRFSVWHLSFSFMLARV